MAALNRCIFSKNLIVCSSADPKILAFGSHCSANFQPILDCFIPNLNLKYEDSENIKGDRVSIVVFNLHQIKRRRFFWDTRYMYVLGYIFCASNRETRYNSMFPETIDLYITINVL